MKLDVLSTEEQAAWYADGLRFTCTQCGNCCTGGPGFVWISVEEVVRLAAHLRLSPEQVVEKYCRKIDGKFSLRERRNARGEYDCIFLKEVKAQRRDGDETVVYSKRVCTVYDARPLQCRTWPFWTENLRDQASWERSAKRCPGMNVGKRYTLKQIVALRDARDWPQRPPTSAT
jgi:hypothetical protein